MRFDETRQFGIEIECLVTTRAALQSAMVEQGLRCHDEGYGHSTVPYWKIIGDGSICATDGRTGAELISPPLQGRDGLDQLEKACKALAAVNAKVNKSCGLHIHHDAADFNLRSFKNLALLYNKFETTIDALMAPSRRGDGNTYCRSLRGVYVTSYINSCTNIDELAGLFTHGRYHKVNFKAFRRHGTVEFRQHNATTQYRSIYNWLMLSQAMVTRAIAGIVVIPSNSKDSWNRFKKVVGLVAAKGASAEMLEVQKYFAKRARRLAA